ncbi:MAG: TRAM domain-containing protein [Candidatus Anstonellales archaeon]
MKGSEGEDSRFGRRGIRDFGPKPVKVNDELDVTIEAKAAKGDGIAKKDGFVIFVPNTKEGDNVKIKIKELRSSFAIGEVIG